MPDAGTRKPKYVPDPRMWSAYQVACRLGFSVEQFRLKRPDLEAKGFPQHDDVLGGWDSVAIETWLDVRAGLRPPSASDNRLVMSEALKSGMANEIRHRPA